MKNLNKNWLKANVDDYTIEELKRIKSEIIDYSKIDGNYSFQKDPTGDGNDRIFPIIDLSKTLGLPKKEK